MLSVHHWCLGTVGISLSSLDFVVVKTQLGLSAAVGVWALFGYYFPVWILLLSAHCLVLSADCRYCLHTIGVVCTLLMLSVHCLDVIAQSGFCCCLHTVGVVCTLLMLSAHCWCCLHSVEILLSTLDFVVVCTL